jgi:hypothetical protein
MKTSFTTKLLGSGNNTGIEIPETNIKELGNSKKPPVTVDVNGYGYQSTVAVMDGKYMIPFSKAHREATGLTAGDDIAVTLELDSGVREVDVPIDLQTALNKAGVASAFNSLTYSRRKEYARQVNEAKAEETKLRRITKIVLEFSSK